MENISNNIIIKDKIDNLNILLNDLIKIYLKQKKYTIDNNTNYKIKLYKIHNDLENVFKALMKIENDKDEYYIVDNCDGNTFIWNDTQVLFVVLIMSIVEIQTYKTEFWKPFEKAFNKKFRGSAKNYLRTNNPSNEKNLKKANDLIKKIEKILRELKINKRI